MKNLFFAILVFANAFTNLLFAQPGSLDTSFDGDGKLTTEIGTYSNSGRSVALQSDGKIVVAGDSGGDFAVARYNNPVCIYPTANAGADLNLNGITTNGIIGTTSVAGNTYTWSPSTNLSSSTASNPLS